MNVLNIGLAALIISTPPAAAESRSYRWLTTAELENLLRGSRIIEDDNRPRFMRTPEEFHQSGHYVRHEDNYEAHGKYTFRDNAVCDHAYGEREVCRNILIDKEGRYWIVVRTNPRFIDRISIEPLR